MVICLLACTSSFTFEFALAITEVEVLPPWGSSSNTSCSLLKQLYQSYTAVFLLRPLSQQAVCKVSSISAAIFPSLQVNLTLADCSNWDTAKPLGHTFTQSPLAHDWQVPAYSHCSWTSVWFQCQADLWSAWGRDFFFRVHTLFEEGLLTLQPLWTAPMSPCHDSCGIHYKHHIVGNFMWHLYVTLNMYCDLSHYTEHG